MTELQFLIILLLISWLLLWLIQKKDLSVLGLAPTAQRIKQFSVGFIASSLCYVGYVIVLTLFSESHWIVNESYTPVMAVESTWWTLRSVLGEELLFRGALLYLAIRFLGIKRACLLGAASFGIYHWFSYSAFGNLVNMIFIVTGIGGLVFSFAYSKTNSLYLPIGLHWGWNLFNIVIFSNGPLGFQFLIARDGQPVEVTSQLLAFSFPILILPLFTAWYLKYLSRQH